MNFLPNEILLEIVYNVNVTDLLPLLLTNSIFSNILSNSDKKKIKTLSCKLIIVDLIRYYVLPDGRRHGLQKNWYANGQLQSEYIFVDGVLHGIQKYWYPNGQPKTEHIYIHGEQNGLQKSWYAEIVGFGPFRSEYYCLNNKFHGPCRQYHPNGQLKSEYNFIDGEILD